MPSLSPKLQRSRKAFDFKVLVAMLPHPLMRMRAYASLEEARRGRELTQEAGLAGYANVYDFTYTFGIKISEYESVSSATARFDLDANGNYPFSAPSVQFLGVIPWIPHVQPTTGIVCLGEGWRRAQSKMLLAQLALQGARMLNFDEPDHGQSVEFNNNALSYWRNVLGSTALHADLEYPSLPAHLTHGIVTPPRVSGFRVVEEAPVLVPRPASRIFSIVEEEP